MSDYLVASLATEHMPPPPEGYMRMTAACAGCRRAVTWLTDDPKRTSTRPILCGRCALELHKLLPDDEAP